METVARCTTKTNCYLLSTWYNKPCDNIKTNVGQYKPYVKMKTDTKPNKSTFLRGSYLAGTKLNQKINNILT